MIQARRGSLGGYDAPMYPFMSPYCFAANNPIKMIDVNGKGPAPANGPTLPWPQWSEKFGGERYEYIGCVWKGCTAAFLIVDDYAIAQYTYANGTSRFFVRTGEGWEDYTPPGYVDELAPLTQRGLPYNFAEGWGPGLMQLHDAGVGMMYVAAFAIPMACIPGAPALLLYGTEATMGMRIVSGGIDYGSQVALNRISGKSWGQSFSSINVTSVGMSILAPGSKVGNFGSFALVGLRNTAISSGLAYNPSQGYQGLGVMPVDRYCLEVGMGGLGNGLGGVFGQSFSTIGSNFFRSSSYNLPYRLGQGLTSYPQVFGQRLMGGTFIGAHHAQIGPFFGETLGNAAPDLLNRK
ncbi:MAG: hypothetical protein M3Q56_08495 [Bacteroidota bacterium]|nr:hypothetical protein [Bacteroidota bacterium]